MVLRGVLYTYKAITKQVGDPSQEYFTSSCETLIHSVSIRPSHEKMASARKEQCAGIGGGAVLAEEP